ncbi:MAG: fasciclin domain-containing protein [Rubricoccaceae bacterium]|nr:fasciclin domain-containing protein [Rubricoccaceae bacterium]
MRRSLLLVLLPLSLLACGEDAPPTEPSGTVQPGVPVAPDDLVAAASDAGLTTLIALADTAGLVPLLRGEGPYTLFAPTNEAFEALPQSSLDSLTLGSNRPRLERLLQYHVVPGRIGTDVPLPIEVRTVAGAELTFDATPSGVVVRDAQGRAVEVITPDVNVSNGVVHIVSEVLTPPDDAE